MNNMDSLELQGKGENEVSPYIEIGDANESVAGFFVGTGRPHSVSGGFHMLEPFVQPIMMSGEHTLVDDDIHFVMRKLFFEDESIPASGIPQHSGIAPPLPKIPLKLYQILDHLFSKLSKTIRFQQVHSR